MKHGAMARVGGSKKRLYGPRKVLVCGYAPAEQDLLLSMMERFGFRDLPAVFPADDEADRTVADLLALPGGHGRGRDGGLPRAVVLSGVTEKELHGFMAAWKHLGLPPQSFAVLTPSSETWTLAALLAELAAEAAAFAARRGGPPR